MTGVDNATVVFDVLPGPAAKSATVSPSDSTETREIPSASDDATVPWVGEIRAFRAFRITTDGVLSSLSSSQTWSMETTTARCGSHSCSAGTPRQAPAAAGCRCGLYACSNIADIERFVDGIHERPSIEANPT